LTHSEEADLFYHLNKDVKRPTAYAYYKSRFTAQHPNILEIEAIVRAAGMKTGTGMAEGRICAVKALETVHQRYNNLSDVLRVLGIWAEAIEHDARTYDGELLRCVSSFLAEFPAAERDILGANLIAYGKSPAGLISRIHREHNDFGHGDSMSTIATSVLLRIYNTKNRKKLNLEDRGDEKRVADEEAQSKKEGGK
jgi:hypothetical protein